MSTEQPAQTVDGGCLCGQVRFRIGLPTLWAAHCHCTLCRRAHGAAFVTWVGVAAERFAVVAGAQGLVRYPSSPGAVRTFCGRCGSTLFFQSTRWPGEVHVVLANLDGPIDREPDAHVYWADHVAWGDFRGRELPVIEPG
ncbi:MAG TPA: GFA family protein [Steroidobacteraceae bacterium]|nr:GFA family protein [Steroidobacteraceae bacterium]